MNIKETRQGILDFLSERREKEYTTTQITSYLGLKKEYRVEVQGVLNMLCREGSIKKIAKRYSIAAGSEVVSDITLPPPLPSTEAVSRVETKSRVNEVYTGKFDATSLAKNYSYAYVICEEGKDIFVSSEDTLNAYHGDIVEVEITRFRQEKRYGIVRKVIKRNKEKFIGIVEAVKSKKYFRCDSLKVHTLFEVIDDMNAPDNHKVLVEIINWGLRQKNKLPACKVVEVLGEAGNPEVEILSVIKEFDLPLEFPDAVIEEANQFSEELCENEIKRRKDLRELYTITIDPVSAKDFDDAISLTEAENGDLHLYVHIADVSHYIKLGSNLFNEAVNRGNSYYFPKKVIPMLPERLSNKLCSLRPDEDKFTLTVLTVFSKDGKVGKQEVWETVIRSDIRLAYEEVDDYFEGKASGFSPELSKALNVMRKLSEHLSLNRNQRGYLKFDLPEVEYIYDDEGYLKDIVRTRETESHLLIENFMLIANEYVAKLLTKKAKETMYRIHEEPEEKDLHKVTDMLKAHKINFTIDTNLNKTWQNLLDCLPDERYHRVFDRLILRSMKKAKYSINHIPHFGLGLQTYTHFTSPIRRLCDLVVHLQLKKFVFKQPTTSSTKHQTADFKVFEWAGIATEREVIADDAERMMETKVLASFMKKNLGKSYKAIINNINHHSIFIELDDIPVRGAIKLNQLNDDYYEFYERLFMLKGRRKGRVFRLCDEIEVVLANVTDEIVFNVLGYKGKVLDDELSSDERGRKKKGRPNIGQKHRMQQRKKDKRGKRNR